MLHDLHCKVCVQKFEVLTFNRVLCHLSILFASWSFARRKVLIAGSRTTCSGSLLKPLCCEKMLQKGTVVQGTIRQACFFSSTVPSTVYRFQKCGFRTKGKERSKRSQTLEVETLPALLDESSSRPQHDQAK